MDYRYLGKTGLKVSELCLGTQTFGWVTNETEAFLILDRFVDAGGNFFDTADSYNQGASETIFGKWIKQHGQRSSLVVATKTYFPTGKGPNDMGLSRKHIIEAVERSLRRLQTDYIDVYQLHCYDGATPLEETLRALDDLVKAGKICYIGVSNFAPSHLMKAIMLCRMHKWAEIASLQAEYSLLVRSPEWELLPICEEEGVGFLAWSPLAGGWLSGKYRRDKPIPPDSRGGRRDRFEDLPEQRVKEKTWDIIDILIEIAMMRKKTPAQVALNWLLSKSSSVIPVFGARTIQQLEDNLGAVGWALAPEEVTRLDEISSQEPPYPYSFIKRYARKR
ncbi:MAG: aldo/keto reductase [Candidatus Bathyarchaeia archaeon]|uniref:aldo/keto reductase n=1 Tax=Thermofilum sp. TaxID=1961369 RepID=UPI00317A0F38